LTINKNKLTLNKSELLSLKKRMNAYAKKPDALPVWPTLEATASTRFRHTREEKTGGRRWMLASLMGIVSVRSLR
jgi:hypothetical protein